MAGSNKKVDLKCVLLGRAAVGKSCLVERFLHDRWMSENVMPTVGAAFGAKEIVLDGGKKKVTLGIWDTAGSERYESMTRHYYKGAEAAVVCFDLTDAESWDKVKFWVKEILTYEENCILALVGTKLDLIEQGKERGVPPLTVQQYATTINAKCYETSSLTGQNVAQPFVDIVKDYSAKPRKQIQAYSPVISLHDEGKKDDTVAKSSDGKPCCSRS